MDKTRPTKKQKELLNFIDGFIKGYGYGPSYREIMRALDYKSVSTVAIHINGLITRGWLVKKDNSARSLVVLMPQAAPTENVAKATAAIVTAEQAIKAKIELLKTDYDTNAHQISVLYEALAILGYETGDQQQIA